MKYILSIMLIFILVACSEKDDTVTSISGLIQNPTHDHIYVSGSGQRTDTLIIQDDGSFHSRIDVNKPKLMVFEHPPEYQTFYVKPGDSLSFRLNTFDFDGSLVFSGDSSEENNFLMDVYLMNEANNDLILSYYKIPADVFIDKTDSIKANRMRKLRELHKKHHFSEDFMDIAKKSINYEYYDIRERYAFLLKKYFPKKARSMDDGFFEYRKSVDFNDAELISHFGYLRFLDDHLKNLSIKNCPEADKRSKKTCFDLTSFNNIHRRLKLVDSIFSNDTLKKKFLGRFFEQEMVHVSTQEQLEKATKLLDGINIGKEKKQVLKSFFAFHKNFIVGKKIDELPLKNHDEDTVKVGQFTDKPYTAIHVWSLSMPMMNKNRFELINRMREKHDDINFIGINVDPDNYNLWQQNVDQYGLTRHHELQTVNSPNYEHFNYYLNRFTLIDDNGKVIATEVLNTDNDIREFIISNTQKKPE